MYVSVCAVGGLRRTELASGCGASVANANLSRWPGRTAPPSPPKIEHDTPPTTLTSFNTARNETTANFCRNRAPGPLETWRRLGGGGAGSVRTSPAQRQDTIFLVTSAGGALERPKIYLAAI
jgi:hypothetical protein